MLKIQTLRYKISKGDNWRYKNKFYLKQGINHSITDTYKMNTN
jgi:hypothetical protein